MNSISAKGSAVSPDSVPAARSLATTAKSGPSAASLALSTPPSPSGSSQPPQWSEPTRYLAGVGLVLFFIWLIAYSSQTLTMLLFAALIAIIVRPLIDFLHIRARFSQGLAVTVTYLLVTLVLFAIPLLIVPNILHAISSMTSLDWTQPIQKLAGMLSDLSSTVDGIPLVGASLSGAISTAADAVLGLTNNGAPSPAPAGQLLDFLGSAGKTLGLFGSILGPLVSGVVSLFFMLLISLQMTFAGGQITSWLMKLVPPRFQDEIRALLDRVMLTWVSFLRGEVSLMVVMGVLVWIMNVLLGTPQALLLGLLSGLLEVIPSLGPVIATIPAAILALIFGSSMFPGLPPFTFMLIVIAGYVLLNLVENQVLVPRILGDAVNVPPLIVLVGVTIAGAQAGIVGVFLATPMIASGGVVLQYILAKINEVPEIIQRPDESPSLGGQVSGFLRGLGRRLRRKR